jgi:hypothetical protein
VVAKRARRGPSTDSLREALTDLQKRARREIDRCETPRSQGTALTGGWAKIGNRTHDLLCAAITWIAESDGLDVADLLHEAAPAERDLGEVSFLTLGRIIRKLARSPAAQAAAVQRLVQDVLSKDSTLSLVTKKRRDKVHEREQEARIAEDLRVLRALDQMLRKVQQDLTG